MSNATCLEHGPHQGMQFLDGYDEKTNRSFGRSETFCIECRDRDQLKRYPWRDHPDIKALREKRRALNLTLSEVAAMMPLHPADVSAMEQGKASPGSDQVAWLQRTLRKAEGHE